MNFTDAPDYTPVPFANGAPAADRNVIPVPSQIAVKPGAASFTDGFPPVTFQPLSSGGVPPFGADVNGILFDLSAGQRWQQAGGTYQYNATFAAATGSGGIGGYPKGALLARADGNGYWLNLTDANATDPDTGGAGWAPVRANIGTSSIAMVVGNNTPVANVLASATLLMTGSLASAATLVLPLTAGANWTVVNNTTGAGAVNIAGATGTGISIAQGVALNVFTDGVNFYAVAAPTTGQYLPINGTAVAATKLATARAFSITGFATAAAVNFDGTGNVVFSVTALNIAGALGYTPANDASVVHFSGSENISGTKQFTGYQIFNGTVNPNALPSFGGLALAANMQSPEGEADLISGNGGARGYGFNFYSKGSSGVATLIASINVNYAFQTVGAVSIGSLTATTGTFSGAITASNFSGSSSGTNTGDQNLAPYALLSGATFTGAVNTQALTCTTMNATSSDRRLKRNIRKTEPRPLHRSIPYVSFERKADGSCGRGAIAQGVLPFEPCYVGTFTLDGKERLSLDYQSMAYEQATWAGREVDRLTMRVAKLERALARAKIEPRKRGFVRRLLEAIW